MERLEWKRGKSAIGLAEVWGVAVATVEGYSAEASRRVIGDPDEARRDITAGCRKLFRKAVDDENAKDAKAVGELWAMVSGAKAPEHRVVTTAASPDEASRLVRQAFGDKATPKLNGANGSNGANGHGPTNGHGS